MKEQIAESLNIQKEKIDECLQEPSLVKCLEVLIENAKKDEK